MKKRVQIVLATTAVSLFICGIASAQPIRTGLATYFSGPQGCPTGKVLNSLYCQGPYCSDIYGYCVTPTPSVTGSDEWTNWVSSGEIWCDYGHVANGFEVSGVYSPYVRLRCIELSGATQNEGRCYWSDWFSEEWGDGDDYYAVCDYRHYVHGAECSGTNCDNMRIRCCRYD